MSKSLSHRLSKNAEEALEDVGKALREAAGNLTEDAESAVAEAAHAVRKASATLAEKAGPVAKSLAGKAAQEAKDHPIASAVAALTAAAALISLLSASRRNNVGA